MAAPISSKNQTQTVEIIRIWKLSSTDDLDMREVLDGPTGDNLIRWSIMTDTDMELLDSNFLEGTSIQHCTRPTYKSRAVHCLIRGTVGQQVQDAFNLLRGSLPPTPRIMIQPMIFDKGIILPDTRVQNLGRILTKLSHDFLDMLANSLRAATNAADGGIGERTTACAC